MYKRPNLYTSYSSETSILPTWTQRLATITLIAAAVVLPFNLPIVNQIPVLRYLGDSDWIRIPTAALIFAVAALGLNLLTGVAGQVSLGHAFFMGVGAYAAAFLGGDASGRVWGHGLPMWIWLPGAGICAALVGILVAPAAVRVRGLYLGIVTIGLVFIGIHLSSFFAGIGGAVYASFIGQLSAEDWDLLLSIEFIAIILIGGAGSIAGTLLGVFFVVLLPRHLELFVHWMSDQSSQGGTWGDFWGFFISTGAGDFGFVSDGALAPGFALPSAALPAVLYGVLIVVFLLFEPRGLFGIWVKFRNYWKGWPFTY